MIGIPVGLMVGNAAEWLVHKHVLHGLGKNKSSFWAFHWREHHQSARKNCFFDEDYARRLFIKWDPQTKEAVALLVAAIAHLPLLPIAPFYTATIWYCAYNYYRKHKRSHLDPEWARKHLPWHVDHHLGRNQDANWCVTRPWFDLIMGTREPYINTHKELEDLSRRKNCNC